MNEWVPKIGAKVQRKDGDTFSNEKHTATVKRISTECGFQSAWLKETGTWVPVSDIEPVKGEKVKSDGGSTSYYAIPAGATDLIDLIEHKKMSFSLGNIFKACYRLGEKDGADAEYDLNKIIYFAERMKKQLKNNR